MAKHVDRPLKLRRMLSSTEHGEQPKSLAEVYKLICRTDPRDRAAMRKAVRLLFDFPPPAPLPAFADHGVEEPESMLPTFVTEPAEELQESELPSIFDDEPCGLLVAE